MGLKSIAKRVLASRPLYSTKTELLWAAGLIMFFAGLSLHFWYESHLPMQPDIASGRIYLLDDHGRFFYMTSGERFRLYGLLICGWALGAVGIAPKVKAYRDTWKQTKE